MRVRRTLFPSLVLLLALTAAAPEMRAQAVDTSGQAAVPPGKGASALKMMFRAPGGFTLLDTSTATIAAVHGASLNASQGFAENTFATIFLNAAEGAGGVNARGGGASPRKRVVTETQLWDTFFVDGQAPTKLGGVRVLVNGRPAFISFTLRAEDFEGVNFDQVNFITPNDDTLGDVQITVESDLMTTVIPATIVLQARAPGFFPFEPEGRRYIAAVENSGEAFIAPPRIFEGVNLPLPVRAARTDDLIQLFGTGFGPTDPPFPAGTIPSDVGNLVDEFMVTIGGMPAEVLFAGVTPQFAGLVQFVIRVPALANGDHEIIAQQSGGSFMSQPGLFLNVDNSQ